MTLCATDFQHGESSHAGRLTRIRPLGSLANAYEPWGEMRMPIESDDRGAIACLLSDYGRLLDARDGPSWAALFAPDGEWHGGEVYGVIRGQAALAAFIDREFAGTPPCVHMLGNAAITLHGDAADVWSRWTLIEQRADGLRIALAGHYVDRLVRLDAGWRFRSRTVALDLPAS